MPECFLPLRLVDRQPPQCRRFHTAQSCWVAPGQFPLWPRGLHAKGDPPPPEFCSEGGGWGGCLGGGGGAPRPGDPELLEGPKNFLA